MSPSVAYFLCCLAALLVFGGLVWLGAPKFRTLYPQFQSGPFWAAITLGPLLLFPPALAAANHILGTQRGPDSWPTFLLVAGFMAVLLGLIRLVIPQTRRSIIAFDQHLMRKPVTGRLSGP